MASPNLLQDLSQQQQPDPLQQASDNVFQRPQPQPDQTLQSPPQPQQPPQGQPQPGQQPQQDPVQARMATLAQTIAQNSPQSADPTAVRGLLGNFFHQGMGALMNHVGIMTPEQKAQNATIELMRLKTGQAAIDLKDAQVSQAQQALDIQRQQAQQFPATGKIAEELGVPEGAPITMKDIMAMAQKRVPAQIKATAAQNIATQNNATKQNIADNALDQKTQAEQDKNDVAVARNNIMLRALQVKAAAQGAGGLPTAQRANKADLAVNIQQNVNDLKTLITKEPELFGKIAGHFTTAEQMIGSNDPTIATIGIAVHNAALANNSIHGIRSAEGAKATENILLNHFRNGPAATIAALEEMSRSAGSFIGAAQLGKSAPGSAPQPQQGGPSGRRVIDFTK